MGYNNIFDNLSFIYEIRVEYIKLIPLHNLRRRIIYIIVSLIVEIPIVTHLDSIEILRSFGFVFLTPRGFMSGYHFIEVDLILL